MNKKTRTYLIHGGLFVATLITTTIAGAEWTNAKSLLFSGLSWEDFLSGFMFSIPFLLIFTFHEFGHYFTARSYKVNASLPYFIPLPPLPTLIGTLGAVIRLRDRVKSAKQNFDIGIAGPLAGFVIAMFVLWYGYTHLPDTDYVYDIHPEYHYFGENYADYAYSGDTTVTLDMVREFLSEEQIENYPDTVISPLYGPSIRINKTLMISFFEKYVVPEEDKHKIPNEFEMAHYPYLFAGFLALFFTALNLLPIGQLDGGHVVYGLFGERGHTIIATIAYFGLLFYAGLGLITLKMPLEDIAIYSPLYVWFLFICLKGTGMSNQNRWMYAVILFTAQFLIGWQFPDVEGFAGWLLLGLLIGRVIGVKHPPSEVEEKLDPARVFLGWLSLIILILCSSCARNPVTGKRDFMLLSKKGEVALGQQTDPSIIASWKFRLAVKTNTRSA